jgi:hypothetical protein
MVEDLSLEEKKESSEWCDSVRSTSSKTTLILNDIVDIVVNIES